MYTVCYQEPLYRKVKAIRLGQLVLTETDHAPLLWIKEHFGVTAYAFDFKKEAAKTRVDLMLNLMRDSPHIGYANQQLVHLFRNFLLKNPERHELTQEQELFVVFETCERVATEEMLDEAKENELTRLPQLFKTISHVHNAARSFTIFYFTNAQLELAKTDGTNKAICDYIYQSLQKHDPFNYCKPDTIQIHFDSMEVIDKDYNGQWIDYYR